MLVKWRMNCTYQLYGPVTAEKAPGTEIIFQLIKVNPPMDYC